MNTLFATAINRSKHLWSSTSKTWTSRSPITTTYLNIHRPSPLLTTRPLSTPAVESTGPKRPSAIEKANLPLLTPGQAIRILQIHAANGRALIRGTDFHKLCNSARAGKKRDAKVITKALKDFKRCNKFILNMEGGRLAVQGIMRAMIPNYKVVYGMPKVEAGTYALETIVDESTGLYFTVEASTIDLVLEEVKVGLDEMKERGANVKINLGEEAELDEEKTGLKSALKATESTIKMLIKRRCRPENDKMKKRAKRKYLKHLKTNEGPDVNTMTLATQISLAIGGVEYTKANIIEPYTEAWWTKGEFEIDESVLKLVAHAEEAERAVAAAEEEKDISDADADSTEDDSEDGETEEEETK